MYVIKNKKKQRKKFFFKFVFHGYVAEFEKNNKTCQTMNSAAESQQVISIWKKI